MGHREWEEGRLRWKERELVRLERELADAKAHGTPEQVAALEFEVADLRLRGVTGTPIEFVVGEALRGAARSSPRHLRHIMGLADLLVRTARRSGPSRR